MTDAEQPETALSGSVYNASRVIQGWTWCRFSTFETELTLQVQ